MEEQIDKELIYVTDSLYRMDIVYLLSTINCARNYEIANILNMAQSHVSAIAKGLSKHQIINSEKVGRSRVYSLTNKGKQIAEKMKDYHGIE